MSENIFTIAVLKAKPGRLGDLQTTLAALAEETRKEPGALKYFFVHYHHHDENTIVSYERWADAEEEAKHWQTPHLNHAISAMKDILEGEPVIHRGPLII